jgi:hypothetical protein
MARVLPQAATWSLGTSNAASPRAATRDETLAALVIGLIALRRLSGPGDSVASLIQLFGLLDANKLLAVGKRAAFAR